MEKHENSVGFLSTINDILLTLGIDIEQIKHCLPSLFKAKKTVENKPTSTQQEE